MPPSHKTSIRYRFSDDYVEKMFYFWYKNRHLGEKWFNAKIFPDENNQKCTWNAVRLWISQYGWEDRANALDVETVQRMDSTVIDERIKMFQEHAQIGAEIKDFGLAYLRENGVSGDMAALRAVADGVQLERSSRGLADSLTRLAQMDDTALLKEINKMLALQQNTIDAEVEDITVIDEDSE
jgi:hypothetical protein